MSGTTMQAGGMQGAGVQPAGQPGGFSPGQNQVTPQDHEKVSETLEGQVKTLGFVSMGWNPASQQNSWSIQRKLSGGTNSPEKHGAGGL